MLRREIQWRNPSSMLMSICRDKNKRIAPAAGSETDSPDRRPAYMPDRGFDRRPAYMSDRGFDRRPHVSDSGFDRRPAYMSDSGFDRHPHMSDRRVDRRPHMSDRGFGSGFDRHPRMSDRGFHRHPAQSASDRGPGHNVSGRDDSASTTQYIQQSSLYASAIAGRARTTSDSAWQE